MFIVSFIREHLKAAKDRQLYRRLEKEVDSAYKSRFAPSSVQHCLESINKNRVSLSTPYFQTAVYLLEASLHYFAGRYEMAILMTKSFLEHDTNYDALNPFARGTAAQYLVSSLAAYLIAEFPSLDTLSPDELMEMSRTLQSFNNLVKINRNSFNNASDQAQQLNKSAMAVVIDAAAKVNFHIGNLADAASLLKEAETMQPGHLLKQCEITAVVEEQLFAPWRQFVKTQLPQSVS